MPCSYHGPTDRGSTVLNLHPFDNQTDTSETAASTNADPGLQLFNLTMPNISVPSVNITNYMCSHFEVPVLGKQHIVRWETTWLVDPQTGRMQWVLLLCPMPHSFVLAKAMIKTFLPYKSLEMSLFATRCGSVNAYIHHKQPNHQLPSESSTKQAAQLISYSSRSLALQAVWVFWPFVTSVCHLRVCCAWETVEELCMTCLALVEWWSHVCQINASSMGIVELRNFTNQVSAAISSIFLISIFCLTGVPVILIICL